MHARVSVWTWLGSKKNAKARSYAVRVKMKMLTPHVLKTGVVRWPGMAENLATRMTWNERQVVLCFHKEEASLAYPKATFLDDFHHASIGDLEGKEEREG